MNLYDIIILLSCIALIAYVCVIYYRSLRERRLTLEELRRLLRRSLRKLSCKPSWRWDNRVLICNYDYQGGHFSIRINSEDVTSEMAFLFFFDAPVSQIDIVRQVVNLCNVNSHYARIVYSVNNDRHNIDLHILAPLTINRLNATMLLQSMMDEAFQWRNAFAQRYESMVQDSKRDNVSDYETERADFTHEIGLLHEQEIVHQNGMTVKNTRDSNVYKITLRQLLSSLLQIEAFLPKSLYVTVGDKTEKVETDDVSEYVVSNAIIKKNSNGKVADYSFAADSAILRLNYYDKRQPGKERRLVVMLTAENRSEQTLYYRATVMEVPLSSQPAVPFGTHNNRPHCQSALLGFDITDPTKSNSEFYYYYQETLDKLKKGEVDQLDDDQLLLARSVTEHTAQNVYYGTRRFHDGRYLEAIGLLEQAYESLNRLLHEKQQPKVEDWKSYNDVCFYLAFSYMELGLYRQAYYYLDILLPQRRYAYTTEYINCLVNYNDLRALNVIDHFLNELENVSNQQSDDDSDDDDDEQGKEGDAALESFISFLKRRKSYVLIECKRYDEAEKLLKEMLNDPSSSDYAINELAYLKKIKTK
ncbi:MAG: hypothetical protein ACOYJG_09735 [Prevotella sp.]|jgi:hypothetical protein